MSDKTQIELDIKGILIVEKNHLDKIRIQFNIKKNNQRCNIIIEGDELKCELLKMTKNKIIITEISGIDTTASFDKRDLDGQ